MVEVTECKVIKSFSINSKLFLKDDTVYIANPSKEALQTQHYMLFNENREFVSNLVIDDISEIGEFVEYSK